MDNTKEHLQRKPQKRNTPGRLRRVLTIDVDAQVEKHGRAGGRCQMAPTVKCTSYQKVLTGQLGGIEKRWKAVG